MTEALHLQQQINPLDPPYQVCPDYPPNKQKSWKTRDIANGWAFMHKSVLGELDLLVKTIRATQKRTTSLQRWEVAILQRACQIHMDQLEGCLSLEDDFFFPFLATRINMDTILPDRRQIRSKAEVLSKAFAALEAGRPVRRMVLILENYRSSLSLHFQKEFHEVVPLLRAFFTPEDLRSVLMKAIGRQTKHEAGAFVYFMGEDYFRNTFMPNSKIPNFMWFIVFRGAFRTYKRDVVDPLKSVKEGQPVSFRGIVKDIFADGKSSRFPETLKSQRSLRARQRNPNRASLKYVERMSASGYFLPK